MLFRWGRFKGAAGYDLNWKIECDALDDKDWECIARMSRPLVPAFATASGVPRGGVRLAEIMDAYRRKDATKVLIVDDVWTTGLSMHRYALELGLKDGQWHGFVVFSRSIRLPHWVTCLCEIQSPA